MGDGYFQFDSAGNLRFNSEGKAIVANAGTTCCCGTKMCVRYANSHWDCSLDGFTDPDYDDPFCMDVATANDIISNGWVFSGAYPTCTAKMLLSCIGTDCPDTCTGSGDCPTATDQYDPDFSQTGGAPNVGVGIESAPCGKYCPDCCTQFHLTSSVWASGHPDPTDSCFFDIYFNWSGPANYFCQWGGSNGLSNGLLTLTNCAYTGSIYFPACSSLYDPVTDSYGSVDCEWYISAPLVGTHCPGAGWTVTGKQAYDASSTLPRADSSVCPDLVLSVSCTDAP